MPAGPPAACHCQHHRKSKPIKPLKAPTSRNSKKKQPLQRGGVQIRLGGSLACLYHVTSRPPHQMLVTHTVSEWVKIDLMSNILERLAEYGWKPRRDFVGSKHLSRASISWCVRGRQRGSVSSNSRFQTFGSDSGRILIVRG